MTERAHKSAVYGPEAWRTIDGATWSHRDLWFRDDWFRDDWFRDDLWFRDPWLCAVGVADHSADADHSGDVTTVQMPTTVEAGPRRITTSPASAARTSCGW